MRALVTGASGFIGHHLVNYLHGRGYWVRGVDIVEPEFAPTTADEFHLGDLRELTECVRVVRGVDEVYHLAADMGGIGYITGNHARLARGNAVMDANMLHAAASQQPERYFYASSACVYPAGLQTQAAVTPLRESDAIPAEPERGYGWEKLFAEQLASYYHEDLGLPVRVARFHNIYGPEGTYEGGREKAPLALCRKVFYGEDDIVVWGDGQQTRSFTYVDDCVDGIWRIAHSEHPDPLNLGSDELVSIDDMVEMICDIAGKRLHVIHDTSAPQGVRGRNSDNAAAQRILGWSPTTALRTGLRMTYAWLEARLVP